MKHVIILETVFYLYKKKIVTLSKKNWHMSTNRDETNIMWRVHDMTIELHDMTIKSDGHKYLSIIDHMGH